MTKKAPYKGVCIDAPGYDAGKKIKGKKRHVLVDTLGLLPFLQKLFADGGYQGPEFSTALAEAGPPCMGPFLSSGFRAGTLS